MSPGSESPSHTLQAVFLIDSNILRQSHVEQKRFIALLRLSCLRILSSLCHRSDCRQVRWGYRLYNLESSPLATHRHSKWKEFNSETFEEFEDRLERELVRQSTLVATPRKTGHNEEDNSEGSQQRPLAVLYSNVLCALIEDFQWELPVISSPVKQIKGRSSRPSHTTSFIRNFVFNFQHCPSSIEALTHFTGQSCTKPTHLVNSILSRSAQEKWKEKEIGLYWVHSDSAQTSLMNSLLDLYRPALQKLGGQLLHISDIVQMSVSASKLMLSYILHNAEHSEAPVTPVEEQICHLLCNRQVPAGSSQPIKICSSDKNVLVHLDVISMSKICKLSVEYLYSLGVAPSNMIKLEYLENNMNFFCNIANMASVCQRKTRSSVSPKLKKDNSQTLCSLEDNSTDEWKSSSENLAELHSLLVKLAASNSVMILDSKVDGTHYVLKPLTVNTATLSAVKASSVHHLSAVISTHCQTVRSGDMKIFTGKLISQNTRIQPIESAVSNITASGTEESKKSGLEKLQEIYRKKLEKCVLVEVPEIPTEKPKSNRETKRTRRVLKSAKLSRGSSMVEIAASKPKPSTEVAAASVTSAGRTPSTPSRKIKTKIVSSIDLRTESELLTYVSSSYESAVTGQSDVYLTAQSIVNTVRVFYKNSPNIVECVEDLLTKHVLKPCKTIRKTFSTNSERKSAECKISTLLILELQSLHQELSVEVSCFPPFPLYCRGGVKRTSCIPAMMTQLLVTDTSCQTDRLSFQSESGIVAAFHYAPIPLTSDDICVYVIVQQC
ncbi:TICRR [Bugula neritina]|uniref:TICRR n=1 Tax=Bugula neritina TaxID=10212 RepID=A0A7J7KDA7_BUGNE|nr:TICRR [Bugula neritina]